MFVGEQAKKETDNLQTNQIIFFGKDSTLVAQKIQNLPARQETQVRSMGQEDPLEKGMATHSSILTWRIPWTKEPGRVQSMALQRVGYD